MNIEAIIEEQTKVAPLKIKEILSKEAWSQILSEEQHKYNLTKDQVEAIETEILFVLLSLQLHSEFKNNIRDSAGLTEDVASLIADNFIKKFFSPIKDLLPTGYEESSSTEPSLPMIEEGEGAHDTTPQEKGAAPTNLPTATSSIISPTPKALQGVIEEALNKDKTNRAPSYPGGKDPYREPIE